MIMKLYNLIVERHAISREAFAPKNPYNRDEDQQFDNAICHFHMIKCYYKCYYRCLLDLWFMIGWLKTKAHFGV